VGQASWRAEFGRTRIDDAIAKKASINTAGMMGDSMQDATSAQSEIPALMLFNTERCD
jgi:hypothetical protein